MSLLKEKSKIMSIILILTVLTGISIVIAVSFGSVKIPVKIVYEVIIGKILDKDLSHIPKSTVDIIWIIRLPRVLLALIVGIGLSLAGVIMQAIVKNPLADPYILGVSSGASLGATLAIMLGIGSKLGGNYVGLLAFLGAFGISLLVIFTSNLKGPSNSTKLLLSGMAFSTLASACSSFIVYFAQNQDGIKTVTFWLMGSLSGGNWKLLKLLFPVVLISTIFFITQYRTLNLMLLGDEVSITLGKDLHNYRILYLLVTSLNIGLIVYASGIIGFVGLIIPHFVRMFFGTDHQKLIPISTLVGAIFIIWMDLVSRTFIEGGEIPIGILVSLIGAPIFIYLMVNKSYDFGGGD